MKSTCARAEPGHHGIERLDLHALEAGGTTPSWAKLPSVLWPEWAPWARRRSAVPRGGAKRGRNDGHVVEAVAAEVALEVGALARAGLDGHHTARRPDPPGGEQRVVAVVGADIDEHHAGLQHRSRKANSLGSNEPQT